MPLQILLAVPQNRFEYWNKPLSVEFAKLGIEVELLLEANSPESIDYVIYAKSKILKDFRPFVNLKAVLSLWAGVEDLISNQTINCPISRMVESGMTESMTEWVTAQVLRHHLGLDRIIAGQNGVWRNDLIPPLARNRTVAILGLGELGRASAASLAALNFKVIGWSRSPKSIAGIDCRCGWNGLTSTVTEAEIISLLLPHTKETENLLNADLLANFRYGSVIINSGRGALIDDHALIAALDKGHIAHATLDVFYKEPLPVDHPFWSHKSVTVSPHIAADSRTDTSAAVIAENIRRFEKGEPLLYLCDKERGY